MSTKPLSLATSSTHPAVGTLIDGGALELVEALGVGGYGVVYRAVDPRYPTESYAVKCLVASGHKSPGRRPSHIREITLHQLASAHPGIATLHRVIDKGNHTYIVMDYAADHDLSMQILHTRRYLGRDDLIKNIFLQLIDAVQYCHSLGIYHRDLKPENILCFDGGLRVAVTDFGLATKDKISKEFRTGSAYHMSPECQGDEFAPTGHYSPMFNDIWSLGIILLNLATGRNPWKSATPDDPTFQAYLRDPEGFLPAVLPISAEVNEILIRMLDVNWRERANLCEVRHAIERATSFYSEGVIFEGSMARCPWESGIEIDSASGSNVKGSGPALLPTQFSVADDASRRLASHWSKESSSDIFFNTPSYNAEPSYGQAWTTYSSCGATWDIESPVSSDSDYEDDFRMECDHVDTYASDQSVETTGQNGFNLAFGARTEQPDLRLMINDNMPRPHTYDTDPRMISFSPSTSIMHTSIEYDPYSSMFFINSPILPKQQCSVDMPDPAFTAVGADMEKTSPSTSWSPVPVIQVTSAYIHSDPSASNSIADKNLSLSQSSMPPPELDNRMPSPAHDCLRSTSPPCITQLQSLTFVQDSSQRHTFDSADAAAPCPTSTNTRTLTSTPASDPVPGPMPVGGAGRSSTSSKSSALSLLASKFFPRSSSPSPPTTPAGVAFPDRHGSAVEPLRPSFLRREMHAAAHQPPAWSHSVEVGAGAWHRQGRSGEADTDQCADSPGSGSAEHTPAYAFVEQKNRKEKRGTIFSHFSFGIPTTGAYHSLAAEAPVQGLLASPINSPGAEITDDYSIRDDSRADTTRTLIKLISPTSVSFATPDPFSVEGGNCNLIAEDLARMSINSFGSSNSSASTEYGSIFLFRDLSSTSSFRVSEDTTHPASGFAHPRDPLKGNSIASLAHFGAGPRKIDKDSTKVDILCYRCRAPSLSPLRCATY